MSGLANIKLLYEKGQLAEAYQMAHQQLQQTPQDSQLHLLVGDICKAAGKIEPAMTSYTNALKLNPNFADAYDRVGALNLALERYDDALKCYQQAVMLQPKQPALRQSYANALSAAGKETESIGQLFKIIELLPTHADCYFNCLLSVDRQQDDALFEQLVELARKSCPDRDVLLLIEATRNNKKRQYELAKEALESLSFDANGVGLPKEMLRVSQLVRVYDRLKMADECMSATERMNALSAQLSPEAAASKERYIQQLDNRAAYFIKENIDKWQPIAQDSDAMHPVFMVGFPRSGTTLLNNILHSHDKMEVIEEEHMIYKSIARFFAFHPNDLSGLERLESEQLKAIRHDYYTELQRFRTKNAPLVIDKLPLNLVSAGFIERFFSGSKFILSLRHPCDCVLSCYMNWFDLNSAMANYLTLEDSVRLYDKVMRLWEQYCEVLELDVHAIRYEDIVEDREKVLRPLADFLGLEWNDAMMEHEKTAQSRGAIGTPSYNQVTQKIYTDAKYRWQHYEQYLAPHMDTLQPWIKRWGYA